MHVHGCITENQEERHQCIGTYIASMEPSKSPAAAACLSTPARSAVGSGSVLGASQSEIRMSGCWPLALVGDAVRAAQEQPVPVIGD